MSEPETGGTVPGAYPWVMEILQKVPSYTILSGLFLYVFLVANPERENWWWNQLQEHERKLSAAAAVIQGRQEVALRELETKCYSQIADNRSMTVENRKTIMDNQNLLLAQRTMLMDQAKSLDELKALIRRNGEK